MITLYGMPRTRSLRVSWTLEELGLEWSYHKVDLSKGEQKSPEYLQLNPAGKIPLLQDDQLLLTESGAICTYLAERYGKGLLLPLSEQERAKHHEWMSLILCELEQSLWLIAKHRFALPEALRVPHVIETAQWEFAKICDELEQRLPETIQLFSEFSLADILLTTTLNWAIQYQQTLPERLNHYRRHHSRRPALARALEKELAG